MLTSLTPRGTDREAVARRTGDVQALQDRPAYEAIGIDVNGSPVTIEPAAWLVCFVPGLRRQWWHRFADARHKHVFALRPLDDGTWLLMEPWWTRMMVNVLTLEQATKFLRWGALGDVLKVRERIPGCGSQMRGWSNCSVLVSFMLGRAYWTWTPNGLFRKLAGESDVERVNVSQYLRRHVQQEAQRHSRAALSSVSRRGGARLREVLLELGIGVVATMTSRSAMGLHRTAVSEIVRDPHMADALWSAGPGQAVDRVRRVLVHATRRGEIDIDDCALAARRFMAMLKGHLHLEIALGLRGPPSQGEIRDHVACVVGVFLRGIRSTTPVASRIAPSEQRAKAQTSGLPAQALIREIGESMREIVRGDDWDTVAYWARGIWSDYEGCTGLDWAQAAGRIREAWESSGAVEAGVSGNPLGFGSCQETSC